MKGPSAEDQRQVSYAEMNGLGQNLHFYPNHMPDHPYYMHQQQNANYNGNNSGPHPLQQDVSALNGSYYHMHHTPADPEPVADDPANPFAEYAWMADAEEFERQALEQMEQEEFFEACVRQICDEPEEETWHVPAQGDNDYHVSELESMNRMSINDPRPVSALNPNAAEFVPRWVTSRQ